MHYGIEVVPFGHFGTPQTMVTFAQAAEESGWEGIWVWDHILFPYGVGDPWVILSAVAASTKTLKIITGVSPLPRYPLHVLSRMLTSLDILSEGRVIFGTGLGIDHEFSQFGGVGNATIRAAMLDEGLDILPKLWSGTPVTHEGTYYTVKNVTLVPTPVQDHIPIWIGGESKNALRRAAKWDGWIIGTINETCEVIRPPKMLEQEILYIKKHRKSNQPFDIAIDGVSDPDNTDIVTQYEKAGATWWFESIFGLRGSIKEMVTRIKAGPPTK
ncbi:MAG: LLM class flavin-dependent oxidoreductase [Candidatus Methanofastidiosia archaeon]|jgi:alkanesulfonate monooxygenase SsuD/methylene tetrahydromethanopterin reductase-like flavin-dependent oxidoreductase (luciferase family)